MKNKIKKELQEIAPFLGEIRKPPQQQLGRLPEGYFRQFEQKLNNRIEVQQELEEQAPELAKLPKAKLGDLPEGYFQSFEGRLQSKLEEETEIEETPNLIQQIGKPKEGLPAGYFDDFESKLMERIAKEELAEKQEPKIVSIKPSAQLKPWWRRSVGVMSIAASFLLLVMLGTWWVRGEFRTPYQRSMAMNVEEEMQLLQLAEANEYLLRNIDELETEELADGLDESELESLSQQQNASFMPIVQDTIPPKPKQENTSTDKKEIAKKPNVQNTVNDDYQTEIEEDVLEETDLDDLASDLSDDDFAALEAALLKPKKSTPKKDQTQKSEK
jgi:hypothetical protein